MNKLIHKVESLSPQFHLPLPHLYPSASLLPHLYTINLAPLLSNPQVPSFFLAALHNKKELKVLCLAQPPSYLNREVSSWILFVFKSNGQEQIYIPKVFEYDCS